MDISCLDDLTQRLKFEYDEKARMFLAIGLILQCLSKTNPQARLSTQLKKTMSIVDKRHYEFYFDRVGRQVGYVFWSFSDNKVFITDFFSESHALRSVLKKMRDRTFFLFDEIYFFKKNNNDEFVKKKSRLSNDIFFRKAAKSIDESSCLSDDWITLYSAAPYLKVSRELAPHLISVSIDDFYGNSSLSGAIFWISQLISMRQSKTYLSINGEHRGYLSWAWLSSKTILSIPETPLHEINLCEWNEGRTLCLVDIVVAEEVFDAIRQDIIDGLFNEQRKLLLYYRNSNLENAYFVEFERGEKQEEVLKWMRQIR
jgi:hemolysin-activating ACP:hemolysin acyltransferase